MSRRMTGPMRSARKRSESRRRRSELNWTSSVTVWASDTLPPLAVGRAPLTRTRLPIFETHQEPADQAPIHHCSERGAGEEACHDEEWAGGELRVEPAASERPTKGSHEEDEADLREQGEVSEGLSSIIHGAPSRAQGSIPARSARTLV